MNNYLGANVPEKERQAQKQTSGRENDRFKQLENELAAIKEQLAIQNRDNLDAMYNIGMDNLDDNMKRLISETGNSIASIIVKTNENSASIKAFAEWKNGTGTDSLAGFVANATKDFATISMLAQYTTTDEVNGLISNAKAGIISEARQGMATISMLASYTTTTDVNNLISSATAGIIAEAQEGMATVSMIASVTDNQGDITAASIVAAVNKDNDSSVKIKADKVDITGFVTFSDLANGTGSTSISGNTISLLADENGNSDGNWSYTDSSGETRTIEGSCIEYQNYNSYDGDYWCMARLITRDNGSNEADTARFAFVIKTNRTHIGSSLYNTALKLESRGSMSMESTEAIYMSSNDYFTIDASRTLRVRANQSSTQAFNTSGQSAHASTYYFCNNGIYYGDTRVVDPNYEFMPTGIYYNGKKILST